MVALSSDVLSSLDPNPLGAIAPDVSGGNYTAPTVMPDYTPGGYSDPFSTSNPGYSPGAGPVAPPPLPVYTPPPPVYQAPAVYNDPTPAPQYYPQQSPVPYSGDVYSPPPAPKVWTELPRPAQPYVPPADWTPPPDPLLTQANQFLQNYPGQTMRAATPGEVQTTQDYWANQPGAESGGLATFGKALNTVLGPVGTIYNKATELGQMGAGQYAASQAYIADQFSPNGAPPSQSMGVTASSLGHPEAGAAQYRATVDEQIAKIGNPYLQQAARIGIDMATNPLTFAGGAVGASLEGTGYLGTVGNFVANQGSPAMQLIANEAQAAATKAAQDAGVTDPTLLQIIALGSAVIAVGAAGKAPEIGRGLAKVPEAVATGADRLGIVPEGGVPFAGMAQSDRIGFNPSPRLQRALNDRGVSDITQMDPAQYSDLRNQLSLAEGRAELDRISRALTQDLSLPAAMAQYANDFKWDAPGVVDRLRNVKPEQMVPVFRAIDKLDPNGEIRPGDWIALDRSYAAQHGASGYGDSGSRIIRDRVPAKDIVWAGTDGNEWLYSPENLRNPDATVLDTIRKERLTFDGGAAPEVGAEFAAGLGRTPKGITGSAVVSPADHALANVIDLPLLKPTDLTKGQEITNVLRKTFGIAQDDTVATPAMRWRGEAQRTVDSQATRVGAAADAIARDAFTTDGKGIVTNLHPGAPRATIQDIAARLPEFEPFMAPEQVTAMRRLEAEVAPYKRLWDAVGIEHGSRPDIVDGGFYLPRGRADLEGADMPVKVSSGRGGSAGRKISAENHAKFDSMAQGVDAGYEYAKFGDVIQSYAKDAGTRGVDQHVANYLKNVTDESGNLLAKGPADRMDPTIKAKWDDVNKRTVSLMGRLDTAERRAGIAAGRVTELEKAMSGVEAATPTNVRDLAKLPTALKAGERRVETLRSQSDALLSDKMKRPAGSGPVRIKMPATATEQAAGAAKALTAGEVDAALSRFRQIVPDDVQRIRSLDTAINRASQRINKLSMRGGEYAALADQLRQDLNAVKAEKAAVRPDYKVALDRAMKTTTRDSSSIGFSQLSTLSFPDSMAAAANRVLQDEGALRGRGAPVQRTIEAANNLLRGVSATLDVSFMGIQGLLGAARDPMAYGNALGVAARSVVDETSLGKYIKQFDERALAEGRPTSREWANAGLHFGGRESEFAVGPGLPKKISNAVANTPGIKQSNRAFGYFGDVLRQELADTMLQRAKTTDPAALRDLATAANLGTGYSVHRFGGSAGNVFTFAPRFLSSQLELIAKAATDGSLTGQEARQMLGRMIGIGVAGVVLSNEANGRPLSYRELFDPTYNYGSNFMRIRIGGQDISPFGPWDSLVKAVVNAGKGDWQYVARTKASPVLGHAWDLISGENFVGDKVNLNSKDGLLNFAKSFLPFGIQSAADQSPLQTAVGLTGLKVSPQTKWEQIYAATNGKSPYTPDGQAALANHPDLQQWLAENEKTKLDAANATIKGAGPTAAFSTGGALDQAKATRANEQQVAAAKFTPYVNGAQFRENLKDASQNYYVASQTAKGILLGDGKVATDPQKLALQQWFDAIDAARDPISKAVDYDTLAAAQAKLMAGFTPEQKAAIEAIDSRPGDPSVPPAVQKFYADSQKIAASGYWDISDQVFQQWLAAKSTPKYPQATTQAEYWDALRADLTQQARTYLDQKSPGWEAKMPGAADALANEQFVSMYGKFSSVASDLKAKWRANPANAEIADLLRYYGYAGTGKAETNAAIGNALR